MKLRESMRELLHKELQHGEVAALNTLLSGEIAAVDAYNFAMQHIKDVDLIPTLENCRNSHALRVQSLQNRLFALDSGHLRTAGFWGGFTKFIENCASLFGDKVFLTVLSAGEDFGAEQYNNHLSSLDVESRELVESELLPMQNRTFETMRMLCAFLSEGGRDQMSHG